MITESDLREINIIFLEHSKLLNENKILNNEILKLEDVIFGYNKIDSLRIEEKNILNNTINILNNTINKQSLENKKLKKKIKRKKIVNNIFIVLSAFLATFVIVDAL